MKKILCLTLVLVLALGALPFGAVAAPSYGAVGDSIVDLVSDPDSSAAVPTEFGTAAADGRVWADKSVVADIGDTNFDVTLSALAQEYKVETSELATFPSGEAADVLMILDFSGSMSWDMSDSDRTKRFEALVKSVNLAMTAVMNANHDNRVMIVDYYGSGSAAGCDQTVVLSTCGNSVRPHGLQTAGIVVQ